MGTVTNPMCPRCGASSTRNGYRTTSTRTKVIYRCRNGHHFYRPQDYEPKKSSANPACPKCGGRMWKRGIWPLVNGKRQRYSCTSCGRYHLGPLF